VAELRRDPILRRWVIMAPERPGDLEARRGPAAEAAPESPCPFCPGSEHMNPVEIARRESPDGWNVRVTPDRRPLLRIEGEPGARGVGMFDRMNAVGAHELVADTPDHGTGWADFTPIQMQRLLAVYRERVRDLARDPRFRHVLVLKNRGAVWSRYPHAHSHVLATPFVPKRLEDEQTGARAYFGRKERCVFCDQLAEVEGRGNLMVTQEGDFVAFTPFASAYPFEVWVMPRTHLAQYGSQTDDDLYALAALLVDVLARIRRVCDDPAYSVALHTGALDGSDGDVFHWHWEIVPHLGHERGMEWATGIIANPVPPETAAAALRGDV
jgi:UDPglucose--hexose-1-phosphate uridylyltransferase